MSVICVQVSQGVGLFIFWLKYLFIYWNSNFRVHDKMIGTVFAVHNIVIGAHHVPFKGLNVART